MPFRLCVDTWACRFADEPTPGYRGPVLRGIRGATQLERDDAEVMTEAVAELASAMLELNGLTTQDVVSVILTATPDLHCAFPAAAARAMGWTDIPLLCAQEIDVAGAMPRVVRVLIHVETSLTRAEIRHPYLRGTDSLRS